jgi:hypothetical protein
MKRSPPPINCISLTVTGSYNCSCHKGYILQSDGRKCKALGTVYIILIRENRSTSYCISDRLVRSSSTCMLCVACCVLCIVCCMLYSMLCVVYVLCCICRAVQRFYDCGADVEKTFCVISSYFPQ